MTHGFKDRQRWSNVRPVRSQWKK